MNLLSIQDTLKNASDQQLANLLQSPDSTAPSYLVLSELRRRKQMRVKQAEPPSRTIAEDLTKDQSTYADQEGIRSLRMPGYEDEARAAEGRSEGDGIDAMREGGVVRMSDGGSSPRSISELSREDVLEYLQSLRFGPGPGGVRSPYSESDLRTRLEEITAGQRAPMIAQSAGDPNNTVNNPDLNYEAGAIDPRQRPALDPRRPPASFAPPATTGFAETAPPVGTADPAQALPLPPRPPAGSPQGVPQGSPGGARAGGGGGGGGAAAPAGTSIRALTPDGEAPNMQTIMERNLGLIPGMPQELLDRIRSSRTNESERRREAQNMAMIEAGLRIASSNNPRLAGAIGEGAAPAVQAYGQQLSQIRQDQRADLQTEMAAAQFDLQRRYMAGQISSSEYRTALTELGAYRRAALQEAGQNARSGASLGSASADRALTREVNDRARIGRGDFTPEELIRMSPEQRAAVERQYQMRNPRGADVSGLSGGAAVARTEFENARKELNEYLLQPPGRNASAEARAAWEDGRKRIQERVTAAGNRYNSMMDRLGADRPGSPGVGTGTPPPPPGFRIQQ